MAVLSFVVNGPPVPKARARVVNGHAYTPPKTRAYERLVATVASLHVRAGWRRDAKYALFVQAFFADRRRADLDNVVKAIADACNGIVWHDDSQVYELHAYRYHDAHPKVQVTVQTLEGT